QPKARRSRCAADALRVALLHSRRKGGKGLRLDQREGHAETEEGAHGKTGREGEREGERERYIRRRTAVVSHTFPLVLLLARVKLLLCCVQFVSLASAPAGCPRHERVARDGPPRAVLPLPPRRDLPQDSVRELQEARVSYPPKILQASRHQRPPGLLTGRASRRCG
ncbi:unnamed protein product, partial [Ectocarpus fasciculatus]